MTFEEFKQSLSADQPPEVRKELVALWHEAKGDWDTAHEIVQDIARREASWVHAYLHRKEGDRSNASYWYSRAGKPMFEDSFEEEWENLVHTLL